MMNARLFLAAPDNMVAEQTLFNLSPNPFSNAPLLQNRSNREENVDMEILSMTGQLIHSQKFTISANGTIRLTPFDKFQAGLYFIRIVTDSGRQVIRGVKW
jgi:hypothetical protein